jgi:uncharacterized protein YjiK
MVFLSYGRRVFYVFMAGFLLLFVSCEKRKTVLKSPPHYNFQQAQETKLELAIKEISGLAWDGTNNMFLAHNDESGKIFFLDRDSKKIIKQVNFGGKGDYEDIAMVGTVPHVLKSDGTIYRVNIDSSGGLQAQADELGKLSIEGAVDFETMYYDSTRRALILICKNCKMDNKATVSAFAYYLDSTGFDPNPVYRINADAVDSLSPKKTSKLQPSAARIHPRLGKLFIISSAANLLVVTSLNGEVESVHRLAPKMFPQPEGLAFNKTGDMYISNEGVTGHSTILRFTFIR